MLHTSFLLSAYYLGGRIEQIRKAKGITQSELAVKSDCSRRTIIQLEQGANVSIHTLFRVLAALGMAMTLKDKHADLSMLREIQEHVRDEIENE